MAVPARPRLGESLEALEGNFVLDASLDPGSSLMVASSFHSVLPLSSDIQTLVALSGEKEDLQ